MDVTRRTVAPRHLVDREVAVLLVGTGSPAPGLPGAGAVLHPADDSLAALHATIDRPLQAGRPVIALHPSWADSGRLRALRTLRSSLDTYDLVPIGVDLPPLALAVLAGLLTDATRGMDAGTAVAAVGPIARAVRAVGWVGSLKGLPHVSVPFRLHLRSLLPGSVHVVVPDASPQVVRASRGEPLPMPRPESTLTVVAAPGERGDVEAVRAALAATGWSDATWVATSPGATAWWGTDRHVEVVVHPVGDALRSLVRAVPAGALCSWCGRRTSDSPCVFCRHATPVGAQS